MKMLRLHFCDFSTDFVPKEDFFFHLLSSKYDIVLDPERPEFLIYSCYGYEFLNYDCPRIFYTAENIRPDFNLCDYAIGFDYLDFGDRYLRFPNFARYGKQFEDLVRLAPLSSQNIRQKTGFCNFIYSNGAADPARDRFYALLCRYKRVDSPGRHLNNMTNQFGDRYAADWRVSKLGFQNRYRFTIAFENSSSPGYTTEKLMHAFLARTVPIYWGNPLVHREFNPRSFVNCHNYSNLEEVAKRVAELDNDPAQYLAMLNSPCFPGNEIPASLRTATVMEFFENIFSRPEEAAFRRPRYGTTAAYEQERRQLGRFRSKLAPLVRVRRNVGAIFRKVCGNDSKRPK